MFAALTPTVALAQPPIADPNQPTTPTEESGGNMSDTSMQSAKAFGLTAKPLSADRRSTYGGPKDAGLVVTNVASGSPAESAGIQVGDVITKVDDAPMATIDDLKKAWKQDQSGQKSQASIEVVRDHQTKDLQLTLNSEGKTPQPQSNQEAPKGGY
jgi:C-terminal processing protease CtpA/Prc